MECTGSKKIAVVFCVLVLTLLCSCSGTLKAQKMDNIKAEITKVGYRQDTFGEHRGDISTIGGLLDNGWTLFFYDYGKNKADFDNYLALLDLGGDTAVKDKGSNYVIYEGSNNINYWIYARVDNTWLEVCGPKGDKEDIKKFVTGLGYYKD